MYVIGIDAGASKTYCLAARIDGTITGFGQALAGSYEMAGIDKAKENILAAVEESLAQSGASKDEVRIGCFALAGADFYPEDFDMLTKAMQDLGVCKEVLVKNDAIAGLSAGITRPYGVVVIMGSGFNGAGIGKDGTEIRYFAEGFLWGDYGGGGQIGREALFHAFRGWDGRGRPTSLEKRVLEHFEAKDMEQLARTLYYNRESWKKILGLCPVVFEEAYEGDEVACGIIRRMGEEAGIAANAIIKRLGLEHDEFEVVLAGSVFKGKGPLMLDVANSVVHQVAPRAQVITPRYEPVVGAVILALEGAGIPFEGPVAESVGRSVPEELRR
jgi:N-acetylglucosamine kinase-like BadF-type ATPase